jgi:hypothetical protein
MHGQVSPSALKPECTKQTIFQQMSPGMTSRGLHSMPPTPKGCAMQENRDRQSLEEYKLLQQGGRGQPIPGRKSAVQPNNAKKNNHVTAFLAITRAAQYAAAEAANTVAGNECITKEVELFQGPANSNVTHMSMRT